MKRFMMVAAIAAGAAIAATHPALAWHLEGRVFCYGNGLPLANVTVQVVSTDADPVISGSALTDVTGHYLIPLPEDPHCYHTTILLGAGESVVSPASGSFDFCTTVDDGTFIQDWVISSPACAQDRCWLTAGGAKFSSITGTKVGEAGPVHTWGGNVYPGCSPTAGDGGNWNHVAQDLRLHFQGRSITVLRCGNVDGIPPGSTSPQTPFNFIDFTGTGTLKGIKGNKADYGTVYFFSHCEDRNEPGSAGVRDGALKDRYFLHVYSNPADPAGSTLLLVDVDGDPTTVDPVTITDGNMQIHVSSCDKPPTLVFATRAGTVAPGDLAQGASGATQGGGELSFAAGPNPSQGFSILRFGLPRDANVSLAAYDVVGRKVRDLATGRWPAGQHTVTWNLLDAAGRPVTDGVYFVRLRVDQEQFSRTLSIAR